MDIFHVYKNKDACLEVVEAIKRASSRPLTLMEVCGGHTLALRRFGIPSLLPASIKLISGPGCPVCVTPTRFIDYAVALSGMENNIIATFGDLIRVPGSRSSLEREKAHGHNIQIVYSSLEALDLAEHHPDCSVVFLGIGFETTAPTSAAAILEAEAKKVNNFYILSGHKVMPPAMAALITQGVPIDGYICPGHVSVITGAGVYNDIVNIFQKGCVISGFEPLDILQSIYLLVQQIERNKPAVEIQYRRAVKPEGNLKARALMNQVFIFADDWWRGLGIIPASGLQIRQKYGRFDAEKRFPIPIEETTEPAGCRCGDVLKGLILPLQCPLYGQACTPQNPVGACMVSSEGTCAAYCQYADYA